MLTTSDVIKLSLELPIIQEIKELQLELATFLPLATEVQQRILQKLRLDWNFHSNAIEGNPLTYGETIALLLEGTVPKGRYKDHQEIIGHNNAIDFLYTMLKETSELRERDIRELHAMMLVTPYEVDAITSTGEATKKRIDIGLYKTSPNHVKTATGATHYYASVEETPILVHELLDWYNDIITVEAAHPLVVAALLHHRFVEIHPFDDGNGRMTRLLTNLALLKKNYPPIIVKKEQREEYYSILMSQADNGLFLPLINFMGECIKNSLHIYLKGAKGERIEEASDIDKEILLFKKSLKKEDELKKQKSIETLKEVIEKSIVPLFMLFQHKVEQFDECFLEHEQTFSILKNTRFQHLIKETDEKNIFKMTVFSILEKERSLDDVRYDYRGYGFKKAKNTNYRPWSYIEVVFEKYEYAIKYHQAFLSKRYHEMLSKEEIEHIVRINIKKLIEELKEYS